jgi:hypothetical protein
MTGGQVSRSIASVTRIGCILAIGLLWMPNVAEAQVVVFDRGPYVGPFAGVVRLDGSCIEWDDAECRGGFADDVRGVFGMRVGYRTAGRWSFEGTAGFSTKPEPEIVPIDLPCACVPRDPIEDVRNPEFYWLTLGGAYSIHRSSRFDVYASGAVGRIGFHDGQTMTDLITILGGGVRARIKGPLSFRTDVRAVTQWCDEDERRNGFACDDGSMLGHLAWSGGLDLVLPTLTENSSNNQDREKEDQP